MCVLIIADNEWMTVWFQINPVPQTGQGNEPGLIF